MSGTDPILNNRSYWQQWKWDYKNTWGLFFIRCRVWYSFRHSYPSSPLYLWRSLQVTRMFWNQFRRKATLSPARRILQLIPCGLVPVLALYWAIFRFLAHP